MMGRLFEPILRQVKAKPEAANEQRGSPEDWIEFRDARQMDGLAYIDRTELSLRVRTDCWHTFFERAE